MAGDGGAYYCHACNAIHSWPCVTKVESFYPSSGCLSHLLRLFLSACLWVQVAPQWGGAAKVGPRSPSWWSQSWFYNPLQ